MSIFEKVGNDAGALYARITELGHAVARIPVDGREVAELYAPDLINVGPDTSALLSSSSPDDFRLDRAYVPESTGPRRAGSVNKVQFDAPLLWGAHFLPGMDARTDRLNPLRFARGVDSVSVIISAEADPDSVYLASQGATTLGHDADLSTGEWGKGALDPSQLRCPSLIPMPKFVRPSSQTQETSSAGPLYWKGHDERHI